MAWQQRSNPKYHTAQHRNLRAALVRRLKAGEVLTCAATNCVMPTRAITNPRGRDRDGLHLGHTDDGVTYRGPEHNACNTRDAAVRGSAKVHGQSPTPRWVL